MDPREEIKARLSIFDLVSQYVELKKAGRNFKGLCPFHSEKTPSFMVSPEKEIAYCFGCHKGGDIFAFYELVEGADFPQALKALAERTGVELPTQTFESKEAKSQKQNLISIHDKATSFYEKQLWDTRDGEKVLDYVRSRGLTDETLKEFRVGFSPDSYDETYKYLMKNGFEKADIVASGMASTKDTDLAKIFDRFRLRLMFPIFDKNGSVIAFGGRALKSEEPAKYLNSPETSIYHKSEALYGFSHAKDAIRKSRSVIVVEGYFDQMMTYQAGFKNVVAVSGTALTQRHLTFLKRFADTVYFCFDSDGAGREALLRAAELAYMLDLQARVVDLGEFKDPAEAIQESDDFGKRIEAAPEFVDYIIKADYLSKSKDEQLEIKTVNAFLGSLLPIVNKIASSITKDLVLRKLSKTLGVKSEFLYDELNKLKRDVKVKTEPVGAAKVQVDYSSEDYFWGYLFIYPDLFEKVVETLRDKVFLISQKSVYKIFDDTYTQSRNLSDIQISDLASDQKLLEKYSVLALFLESVRAADWSQDMVYDELTRLLKRMVEDYKKSEGERIQRALSAAEKESDQKKVQTLLKKYQQVLSL